jgi:glycosyltransferase involved in cell wall biosynthesis
MKVLVLTPSTASVGGVQSYSITLVVAFRDILGAELVRTVSVASEPAIQPDGRAALGPSAKFRFLFSSVFEAIRWHPDLVVCAHIGVAPLGLFLKKTLGIPYWLTLHGIEVWGDLSPAKRSALQGAKRLISNSRFTLEAVKLRHAVSAKEAVIIPPALANGSPSGNQQLIERDASHARPIVLTVGRLATSERYKGHDVMLDAWQKVLEAQPSALYLIVGDGDDRERLEARAKELGLGASVRFVGKVTAAELNDCYDICRVFAMPARTELDPRDPRGEGFGIVFLEAMAHGKPVIAPRDGAPTEFIRQGEHGLLVDPVDSSDVARALIDLLGDPERGEKMGQAGRKWVRENFSYQAFRRRLQDVLQMESLTR